jgi:hypothetical protein
MEVELLEQILAELKAIRGSLERSEERARASIAEAEKARDVMLANIREKSPMMAEVFARMSGQ